MFILPTIPRVISYLAGIAATAVVGGCGAEPTPPGSRWSLSSDGCQARVQSRRVDRASSAVPHSRECSGWRGRRFLRGERVVTISSLGHAVTVGSAAASSIAPHGVQTPTNRSGGGVCRGRPHDHSRRELPSFARNEHKQQANNMFSPPYGL